MTKSREKIALPKPYSQRLATCPGLGDTGGGVRGGGGPLGGEGGGCVGEGGDRVDVARQWLTVLAFRILVPADPASQRPRHGALFGRLRLPGPWTFL